LLGPIANPNKGDGWEVVCVRVSYNGGTRESLRYCMRTERRFHNISFVPTPKIMQVMHLETDHSGSHALPDHGVESSFHGGLVVFLGDFFFRFSGRRIGRIHEK
jgi:hypothetical protein